MQGKEHLYVVGLLGIQDTVAVDKVDVAEDT